MVAGRVPDLLSAHLPVRLSPAQLMAVMVTAVMDPATVMAVTAIRIMGAPISLPLITVTVAITAVAAVIIAQLITAAITDRITGPITTRRAMSVIGVARASRLLMATAGAVQSAITGNLKIGSCRGYIEKGRMKIRPSFFRPLPRRSILQPQINHLAEWHALVPQNVVGGGDVEEKIRQREGEEIRAAAECRIEVAQFEFDRLGFETVELRFLEAIDIGDRPVDARV